MEWEDIKKEADFYFASEKSSDAVSIPEANKLVDIYIKEEGLAIDCIEKSAKANGDKLPSDWCSKCKLTETFRDFMVKHLYALDRYDDTQMTNLTKHIIEAKTVEDKRAAVFNVLVLLCGCAWASKISKKEKEK